ncbi:hypothetical protein [Streptomyces sp. Tue 6075]|uniref:hypothetical protein n=1 Tax=Streptomyces sp. Tue 6075 TaxID=1661694 RepID=UPI00094B243D|nr:hypothetical protein [Streptomyces sp. Tue 6075]
MKRSHSASDSSWRPRHATELRRRLLLLSVRVEWHPFWSTPAARVELRRLTAGDRRTDAA